MTCTIGRRIASVHIFVQISLKCSIGTSGAPEAGS